MKLVVQKIFVISCLSLLTTQTWASRLSLRDIDQDRQIARISTYDRTVTEEQKAEIKNYFRSNIPRQKEECPHPQSLTSAFRMRVETIREIGVTLQLQSHEMAIRALKDRRRISSQEEQVYREQKYSKFFKVYSNSSKAIKDVYELGLADENFYNLAMAFHWFGNLCKHDFKEPYIRIVRV